MDMALLENELAPFLSTSTKEELKTIAVDDILGLTGTDKGRAFLGGSEKLLKGIISLTEDKRTDIQDNVFNCLINLAADEETSWKITQLEDFTNKFKAWLENVFDASYKSSDIVCKLVSNLTRSEKCVHYLKNCILESDSIGVDKIVLVLCNIKFNENADLHYLGALLSNLSQVREIRKQIMDKEQCIVQRLLPFTEFKDSIIRRSGIIGTLKNCCFDTEYHEWLLSDKVDILPRLLLPLAGAEEFDDEDTEKLPDDLQYLPADKEREPVPEIRRTLLESVLQLCATKKGRQFVKSKNTYVIIREYHTWEREHCPANEMAIMNLIDVLIGDDPTAEFDENLKNVEIPADMQEKFHQQDEDERKEVEKEIAEKAEKEIAEKAEKNILQ